MALSQAAAMADHAFGIQQLDIWKYESIKGSSLRRAIDWLLPFALGEVHWPYKEIHQPTWTGLAPVLRRASKACDNKTYEVACCRILSWNDYAKQVLNLWAPPVFIVNDC